MGYTNNIHNSGSYVGIGTTSPSYKLDVSGSGNFTNNLTVTGSSYLSSVTGSSFTGSFVGDGSGLYNLPSGSISAAGSDTQIQFNDSGNLGASSNLVYSGSMLGIGITTPTSKLQVQGLGTTSATTALLVQNSITTPSLVVLDNTYVGLGKSPNYPIDIALTNGGNANSALFASGIHSDGRAILYGKANTTVQQLIYWWHTGGIGIGTGGSARGGAVSYVGDTSYYGPAHGMYFMETGTTFGPTNIKYRLGITTSTTNTQFASGVTNNLTNIESNTFTYIAKSHTFYTGTTSGNQSTPSQFIPLHLSDSGSVGIGTTTPTYKLDVNGPLNTNTYFQSLGIVFARDSRSNNLITYNDSSVINNRTLTIGNATYSVINLTSNVGIGTSTPSAMLHVKGNGSTSATTNFLLQNSSSTELFKVLDNGTTYFTGSVGIGTTTPSGSLHVKGSGTTTGTTFLLQDNNGTDLLNINDQGVAVLGGSRTETYRSEQILTIINPQNTTTTQLVEMFWGIGRGNQYAAGYGVIGGFTATGTKVNHFTFLKDQTISSQNLRVNNGKYLQASSLSVGANVSLIGMNSSDTVLIGAQYNAAYGTIFYKGNSTVDYQWRTFGGNTILMNLKEQGLAIGLGATNASATLHVQGSGITNGTYSLVAQNSSAARILQVRDDKRVQINTNLSGQFPAIFTVAEEASNSAGNIVHIEGYKVSSGGFLRIQQNNTTQGATMLYVKNAGSDLLVLKDNGNLIIGGGTPSAMLHVKGSGATSATTNLLLQNSNNTNLLKVTDDGQIELAKGSNLKHSDTDSTNSLMLGQLLNTNMTYTTLIGKYIFTNSTSGQQNTAVGWAINNAPGGIKNYNVCMGVGILGAATIAEQNLIFGVNVARGTEFTRTVMIGKDNFYSQTSRAIKVVNIGAGGFAMVEDAEESVAIGEEAGRRHYNNSDFTGTVNKSIYIGRDSRIGILTGVVTNEIVIGYQAKGKGNNTTRIGNDNNTLTYLTGTLQNKGAGATSATTNLLLQNSNGTELLKVTDDGAATFSNQISLGLYNKLQWGTSGTNYIKFNGGFMYLGYTSDMIKFDLNSSGTKSIEVLTDSNLALKGYTDKNILITPQGIGKVGINTTSPQYKLDVNGNLRVEKAVLNYGEALSIAPGTISIETVPTGTFNGAFFDYIGISGSNSRIGTVGAVWIDSFVDYNDTPTAELGSATDLSLSVTLVGGNVEFRATTTTDGWDVKTLIRFI